MEIKLSHTFLAVDDPDKALAFYRDLLGLEVRNDVAYGGMRWITVGAASQPEVDIVLEPPAVNPNMTAEDRRVVADLMAKGVFARVVFWSDDVDATFDTLQSAGADVVQEPTDQPYGVRDCAFRDPAGNEVRFNQAKG
jgi:catechol 2,3-dioxygenase-like lactoylglutathione lyase family enzyme